MWKCHKCGKPVYFAERKQSLGYDWHPECLRCEECGKRLNPGQHAEHKGVPYCHVPCYGALFGPQLFGHGTRVESHKSFGQQRESPKSGNGPHLPRSHLESKLKVYNQYFDGKSAEIKSREVNGRLILEGSLRIHWGVQGMIHLKEDDDQRTVVTVRKRNSHRMSSDYDSDEDVVNISRDSSCNDIADTALDGDSSLTSENDDGVATAEDSVETNTDISDTTLSTPTSPNHDILPKSLTLPPKLDLKNMEWDELDELLQVERRVDDTDKLYQTMPVPLPSQSSIDSTCSTMSSNGSVKKDSPVDSPLSTKNFTYGLVEASNSDSSFAKDSSTNKTPKDSSPKHSSTQNSSNNSSPKNSSPKHSSPKHSSPKHSSPKHSSPKNSSPKNSSPKNPSSKDPSPVNETSSAKEASPTNEVSTKDTSATKDISPAKDSPKNFPNRTNRALSKDDSWIDSNHHLNRSMSGPDCLERIRDPHSPDFDQMSITSSEYSNVESSEEVVLRGAVKTGSTAIKRRTGKRRSRTKIKRRCSINGHFYDRETSFFTPPHGSQMSVWVTSLVNTHEVINLMLEKYKVDSDSRNFALYVVRDNGEQRKLKEDEYPLLIRVLLGPHEEVVRLFLMDSHTTHEVSSEVAQFLNLSLAECRAILNQYYAQEEREVARIKEKYLEMKRRIKQRMEELKVRIKLN